jgi:hypothetical protein
VYVNAPVPPLAVTWRVVVFPTATVEGFARNDEMTMGDAAGATTKVPDVAFARNPLESVTVTLTV